jgi:hypothetical protein
MVVGLGKQVSLKMLLCKIIVFFDDSAQITQHMFSCIWKLQKLRCRKEMLLVFRHETIFVRITFTMAETKI